MWWHIDYFALAFTAVALLCCVVWFGEHVRARITLRRNGEYAAVVMLRRLGHRDYVDEPARPRPYPARAVAAAADRALLYPRTRLSGGVSR